MVRIRKIAFYALIGTVAMLVACGGERDRISDVADPRASELVQRMKAAYDVGEWSVALALADSLEQIDPRLPDAPFQRGLVFTKLKRYDDAHREYKRALDLDPAFRRAWYNIGHNAFLQRKYRDALSYYEKERELLAATARRENDTDGSRLRHALPAVTAQIGRTYALLGVPDSAQLAYQQALTIDSTNAVTHAWLSELYEDRGDIDQALQHAQKALEGHPDEVEYAYRVGFLLFQSGRIEEAALLLSAVVQQWPGHEGASYNLGRALLALGHEKEGQALLDRVEAVQRMQEQAMLAQRSVEMHPEDAKRWVDLARLMLQSGYYDKAEEALAAALVQKPDDRALRHDLANVALVRGDTSLAVERFESLLRTDSTFADAWLNLGIIHAMQGRRDEARAAWERVLRYNPGDPDAKAYLAGLK